MTGPWLMDPRMVSIPDDLPVALWGGGDIQVLISVWHRLSGFTCDRWPFWIEFRGDLTAALCRTPSLSYPVALDDPSIMSSVSALEDGNYRTEKSESSASSLRLPCIRVPSMTMLT